MRLAPAWLLLLVLFFALALLAFGWLSRRGGRPGGEAFINEATNQSPTPDEGARAGGLAPKSSPPTGAAAPVVTGPLHGAATPDATPHGAASGEADSYSVQVGAFADLSQANEQVSRLRAAGFEARVVESGEATRFRFQVRSGLYTMREEAARHASALRAAGVAGQTVIVEPEKR